MSLSEHNGNFTKRMAISFRSPFSAMPRPRIPAAVRQYTDQNKARLSKLIPRERRAVYGLTHLMLPWAYQIVSHPRVLDAVEGAIGPNILVWGSDWFVKFPRDATFISWHQDGAYWGLQPPKVTTAWIALSPSTLESGCMQVMPGTQQISFHNEKRTRSIMHFAWPGNRVDVDESKAVALTLEPGEMSLHHIGIAHGSKANNASYARIGIAVRYIAPEVVQRGRSARLSNWYAARMSMATSKSCAPKQRLSGAEIRKEAERRVLKNVYPEARSN